MATPLNRSAVIDAARDLIARDGLDRVSLRRLASRLGVTAPALYAYVADKGDLLRGVAEGELDRLLTTFATIDDPDPVERLRQLSRAYIDQAIDRPELFRTMFLFPPELDLPGVARLPGGELAMATTVFATAHAAVTAAIDAGALRPADPTLAALTLWTATHGAATVLLMGFPFDDATRDLVVDAVIDNALVGLGASPT
jgi:AcrR family transcriptional regulator